MDGAPFWLSRYCSVETGTWSDWLVSGDLVWSCATDKKTLVMIRDGGEQYREQMRWLGRSFQCPSRSNADRFIAAKPTTQPVIECDLADLLRFAGYVQREACWECFSGSVESLRCWTLERPAYQQIGQCVDCYQTNGWIVPAAPSDDRKARVAGVTVCMSRLAWSIPPELVEEGKRVTLGRVAPQGEGNTAGLLIEGWDWRIVVAECYLTGPASTPSPTFYPDPTFAQLWQSARDDPAAMSALSDWLIDHEDAFAEVLQ